MEGSEASDARTELLRSKRNATRYQILVQIAERQPAVSQQEIAGAIDITAQAVSNYLQELIEAGHVEKHGRGRYEITKEGVDWLISRTDNLRSFVDHVSEEVIGQVDVESAIAAGGVTEGQRVSLAMRNGYLHALPKEDTGATAVAVTDAATGQEVGLTDFEGVVDYDLGTVTVLSVPSIRNGGSAAVEPDVRFGTPEAVREAATKGLDVLLLVVTGQLSIHTDTLRDGNISYEVIDATDE